MPDKLNFVSSHTILYKSFKNSGSSISNKLEVPWMYVKFPYDVNLCCYNASIATCSISWKFNSFTLPFGWLGYSFISNTLLYPIWLTIYLNSTIFFNTYSVHFKKNSLLSKHNLTLCAWPDDSECWRKHYRHSIWLSSLRAHM